MLIIVLASCMAFWARRRACLAAMRALVPRVAASLLDGTIVRLELASRTKLILTSNHLLVLGGRRNSNHGLHSTLTLATHENTILAVTNLPGSNLAERLGITLESVVRPLLGSVQITVSPSDGACVVGIGNTSISQCSLHRSLGSHLLL